MNYAEFCLEAQRELSAEEMTSTDSVENATNQEV